MIIRLTQKLCTKIKAGTLPVLPLDENPLADWSAHLFVADRTQYILLSNTRSLYSTVFLGQGLTNDSRFFTRALNALREFMEADGQQLVFEQRIAPSSGKVQFAKAFSRAVTGSMNELIMIAISALVSYGVSPKDVGFDINGILLSSIAENRKQGYGKPREAFLRLVGEQSES